MLAVTPYPMLNHGTFRAPCSPIPLAPRTVADPASEIHSRLFLPFFFSASLIHSIQKNVSLNEYHLPVVVTICAHHSSRVSGIYLVLWGNMGERSVY